MHQAVTGFRLPAIAKTDCIPQRSPRLFGLASWYFLKKLDG
jgi:hypothetical protein